MKTPKIIHIVIEGSDEEQMYNLFEEIQNKYCLYDNCVIETENSPDDTIIDYDEGRWKETGNIKVLSKRVVDKFKKSLSARGTTDG